MKAEQQPMFDDQPDQGQVWFCRECKAVMHQEAKLCQSCAAVAERSKAAYLEHQKQFLPEVVAGNRVLRIAHLRDQAWHLVLIHDADHAFCGAKIGGGWNVQRMTPTVKICREC